MIKIFTYYLVKLKSLFDTVQCKTVGRRIFPNICPKLFSNPSYKEFGLIKNIPIHYVTQILNTSLNYVVKKLNFDNLYLKKKFIETTKILPSINAYLVVKFPT